MGRRLKNLAITSAARAARVSLTMMPCTASRPHARRTVRWLGLPDSRAVGSTTPFFETGWDFVGETVNGTGDIWWILEGQDYPRLWWEATEP